MVASRWMGSEGVRMGTMWLPRTQSDDDKKAVWDGGVVWYGSMEFQDWCRGQEHVEHVNVRKKCVWAREQRRGCGRCCGVHRVSVGCPARSITSSQFGTPGFQKKGWKRPISSNQNTGFTGGVFMGPTTAHHDPPDWSPTFPKRNP